MSTDFDAVCFRCRRTRHVGQHMGGKTSFGYGSTDIEGAGVAAKFVIEHATHCGSVTIVNANLSPMDGFTHEESDDDVQYAEGT